VVFDGEDGWLVGTWALRPVPSELPGDEGVIVLPDKDERIGALAYDHEVELISK